MRIYSSLILSLALLVTLLLVVRAPGAPESSTVIAVDIMLEGNSATSVGPIQSCLSVDRGDTFDVDVTVTDVQELAGFQVRLNFDPQVVQIRGRQANFLLGEGGLEAGDINFPVTSGSWYYGYTNLPAQSGPGVLVRITLKALASGSTKLSLPLGPLDTALIDSGLSYIGVVGVTEGTVRVGSECTPAETPTVLPVTPALAHCERDGATLPQCEPNTVARVNRATSQLSVAKPLVNRRLERPRPGADGGRIGYLRRGGGGNGLLAGSGHSVLVALFLRPPRDQQPWGLRRHVRGSWPWAPHRRRRRRPVFRQQAAAQFQLVYCPQSGKWAISTWDGPNDTTIAEAIGTCPDTSVAAAYWLDPQTQGWLRYVAGRPEISNLTTVDEMQGILTLGGSTAPPGP